MALYIAEIFGSNAVAPYAHVEVHGGKELEATVRGDGKVQVRDEDDAFPRVALFGSREEAARVAQACHWNGQTFGVRAARGLVYQTGRVLPLGSVGKVRGCQEPADR